MAGPLISPADLAELVDGADATILDVRWELASGADRAAYLEGHIPGSVFVDLDGQLADPPSERGRHPLPSAKRFGVEMRALGVSSERPVVVYDAAMSMAAARAWWLLRYFGHPDVSVLDGGLRGWVQRGHPLTTEVPAPRPGNFVAHPGAMPTLTAADAQAMATGGILLDARARERYLGVTEPIDPVAGHIPGARNRPTAANVDGEGRFLGATALRAAFEELGVRQDVAVAAYCGSGITAAHEVLALEVAGYHAALYPGSWSEWIADPARPVATGEEPR
jgi:thiosulfate/3-mercaptopyruvate sulfurtransferase